MSLQLGPTLCNPLVCSLPGFSVHGILQTRILEWVAISSSRGSFWPRNQTHIAYVSCIGRQALYYYCHLGLYSFKDSIPFWFIASIECSSLCYAINPYCLFYIWWYASVNPIFPIYPFPCFSFGSRKFVFCQNKQTNVGKKEVIWGGKGNVLFFREVATPQKLQCQELGFLGVLLWSH